MKTVLKHRMVVGCVGLSALLFFCLFFFVYFPMLFLPAPKKKKHRSARIANGERLRRRHQAKMVPDNHPSSFCFLVFSVPPPFLSSNIPQAFPYHFFFLPLSRSTSLSSWRRLSCRLHRLPEQWQPSQPSYWFPLACVALYSVVLQQVW